MAQTHTVQLHIDSELIGRAHFRGRLAAVIKDALSCYVLTATSIGPQPPPPRQDVQPRSVQLEAPICDVLLTLQADEGRHVDEIVNDALRHWLDAGVVS